MSIPAPPVSTACTAVNTQSPRVACGDDSPRSMAASCSADQSIPFSRSDRSMRRIWDGDAVDRERACDQAAELDRGGHVGYPCGGRRQ